MICVRVILFQEKQLFLTFFTEHDKMKEEIFLLPYFSYTTMTTRFTLLKYITEKKF